MIWPWNKRGERIKELDSQIENITDRLTLVELRLRAVEAARKGGTSNGGLPHPRPTN